MTTTILLFVAVAAIAGGIGALLVWRHYNELLTIARIERRAAQRETAKLRGAKDADDREYSGLAREYDDLWDHAEGLAADLTVAYETITAQAELIRERGMHDDAVAAAHDAEIVEADDDLPALAAVAAVCPVSPAPVFDLAAPTGSWAFADIRAAIERGRHEAVAA